MKKLWSSKSKLDPVIEAFETEGDLKLDQKLVKYDVLGSIAHTKMLKKIGILTETELVKLQKGLTEILKLYEKGEFTLQFGDEDVHTKIESFLTEKYGEVGKKIHTARSRNDQVLTALKLYNKEQLLNIWNEVIILVQYFLDFAKLHEFVPMPGFTHMQKAMPSSVGMWSGSFVESLLDDLTVLKTAFDLNNKSALGSAAGYGVPLNIDREYTATILGFDSVLSNSLYCQNSKGKIESVILSSLTCILLTINKFAADLLLFTTSEFDYFKVDETLCTGSSIMPQKNNIDVAELLRSKVHLVLGNHVQIVSLSSNLISGYNRDFQDNKKPLLESLELTYQSLKVTSILIGSIYPKKDNFKKALTAEIFATHEAFNLIEQGIPFREAYRKVANNSHSIPNIDPKTLLKKSQHTGATGNLGLVKLKIQLKKEQEILFLQQQKWQKSIKNLLNGGDNNENKN